MFLTVRACLFACLLRFLSPQPKRELRCQSNSKWEAKQEACLFCICFSVLFCTTAAYKARMNTGKKTQSGPAELRTMPISQRQAETQQIHWQTAGITSQTNKWRASMPSILHFLDFRNSTGASHFNPLKTKSLQSKRRQRQRK